MIVRKWPMARGFPQGRIIILPCVVGDNNNPVNMIRHDHEFIHSNLWKMGWNIIPALTCNIPPIVQPHFSIHDFPEQAFPVLRTDGNTPLHRNNRIPVNGWCGDDETSGRISSLKPPGFPAVSGKVQWRRGAFSAKHHGAAVRSDTPPHEYRTGRVPAAQSAPHPCRNRG